MLLERLGLEFETFSPDIDETRRNGESAEDLVARLAGQKADAVAADKPSTVVIGSDQVAACQGKIIGKPGSLSNAVRQLQDFSGKRVQFFTAISVICLETRLRLDHTTPTDVCFRELSDVEIERYVNLDQPLDCAGSFKSERAGISLLESMTSNDPTAIIGLPLIALSRALRKAGFLLP